jgi:hypothetical protein
MNLLEAMISLVIAAGVIAAVLETSHLSAGRTVSARLELEATARAEALLARAGSHLPLVPGRLEGGDSREVRWILEIRRDDSVKGPPDAVEVTADVRISRGGLSARQTLVTLKLVGAY